MRVSAAPNIKPKKMTPSMSVFAAASIGLRGTMLTNVSGPNFAVVAAASTRVDASPANRSISATRVSGVTRFHGFMTLTTIRPSVAARHVVMKK
ncbi:MAG: hypothetical protein IPL75_21750 [Acidobacteria bacterium]|nr:hypothetical protein [Acidobacteriota bacterium]